MHLVNFERLDSHVPAKGAGSLSDAALGFEGLEPGLPGSRRLAHTRGEHLILLLS